VYKYLLRAKFKGSELEDRQKARQYLEWCYNSPAAHQMMYASAYFKRYISLERDDDNSAQVMYELNRGDFWYAVELLDAEIARLTERENES